MDAQTADRKWGIALISGAKQYRGDVDNISDAKDLYSDSLGFEIDKPIATNKTAAGRQQNRSVEFLIVQ